MIGLNGGLFGKTRNTNSYAASGLWTLSEQGLLARAGSWPLNYAASIVLKLLGEGTNNGISFIDSSPIANSITRAGTAVISTAQFKYGSASINLPASSWLQIPNTAQNDPQNNDFTIEAWIYPTSNTGTRCIYATGWPIALYVLNGTLSVICKNNVNAADPNLFQSAGNQLSGGTITLNTWTHVAFTRQGNTFRLFRNGILMASETPTGTIARSTASYIGVGNNPVISSSAFLGYIDNLMVVKGLCLYITDFTPLDIA